MSERIAKFMARSGVCSRREAEEFIRQQRVTVNGEVITSPVRNYRRLRERACGSIINRSAC